LQVVRGDPSTGEDLGGDAPFHRSHCDEHMLGADRQVAGLVRRELEGSLQAWTDRRAPRGGPLERARTEGLLDLATGPIEINAESGERVCVEASARGLADPMSVRMSVSIRGGDRRSSARTRPAVVSRSSASASRRCSVPM
jgi:hypothetical protein